VFVKKISLFNKAIFYRFKLKEFNEGTVVTPWSVKGKVDYNKLIINFGTERIDRDLIIKFEKITGKEAHPWLRRGIFFTHRGLNTILDALDKKENIFLYTGRGPSSSMHLGHLIPFIFTKWLQETLNCPLIIQISDDEKYAFKNRNFEEIYNLGFQNGREIASIGFNPQKTFIFSNHDYRLRSKSFEKLASEMKNLISIREIKKIFGFKDDSSIAMYDWPFYQTAAAYYQSYPEIFEGRPAYCLVPHAIDQDPYFRLARDLSPRLGLLKPCNIMSTFVPPLTGSEGKMSSSENQNATIFLNESENIIKKKIMKFSFSGGGGDGSLEQHKRFGGNSNTDIAFQYLRYFEYDDHKLEQIKIKFEKGELTCGDLKVMLCEKLIPLIKQIQNNHQQMNDSQVEQFYSLDKFKERPSNSINLRNDQEILFSKFLLKHEISYEIFKKDISVFSYFEKLSFAKNKNSKIGKIALLKGVKEEIVIFFHSIGCIIDLDILKKKLHLSSIFYPEKDLYNYIFECNDNNFYITKFALKFFNEENKPNIKNIKICFADNLLKCESSIFQIDIPDLHCKLNTKQLFALLKKKFSVVIL
jgi:tryptophanyl-tRNA synthetase